MNVVDVHHEITCRMHVLCQRPSADPALPQSGAVVPPLFFLPFPATQASQNQQVMNPVCFQCAKHATVSITCGGPVLVASLEARLTQSSGICIE